MRITLVISSLAGGGAERVATVLANAWAEHGHSVTVITFEEPEAVPAYHIFEKVTVMRLDSRSPARNKLGAIKRNLGCIGKLRNAVRKSSPDVVVAFLDQTNVLTLLACVGSRAAGGCFRKNPSGLL